MRNKRINQNQTQQQKRKKGCCMQRALACSRSLSLALCCLRRISKHKKKTQWQMQSDQSDRVREEERERREVYAPKWRGVLGTGHWACKWREWGSSHTGRERERDEWMSWVKVKWLFATLSERVKLLCKNCRGNLHSDRTSMCTCVRARVCIRACMFDLLLSLSLSFSGPHRCRPQLVN